ncbi:MAG: hypothetical protein HRT87_10080 [Legionellales bacterium]|nr:hypothetical protein [Legionellales bacterium]
MADKSKLPDMKEITGMAGKLYEDVKKSVTEIVDEYKSNHPKEQQDNSSKEAEKDPKQSTESKAEESKPEESKPEESKPEESKPEESKD